MKTDDLIRSLAEDDSPAGWSFSRRALAAGAAGACLSLTILMLALDLRADLLHVIGEWRVALKFAIVLTLGATSALAYLQASRPEVASAHVTRRLLAGPLLLAAGVAGELASTPSATWLTNLMGARPDLCVLSVALLSLPPLIGLLLALRHAAPASAMQAGALAGLLAGSLGAGAYILRCTDDSPLFLSVWYGAAIALVAVLGALAGARLLRW